MNVGKWGEDKAEEYLKSKGYSIQGRNVRTPYGEIDIVARKKEKNIFIEVKTRRNVKFGYPEEAINGRKKVKLIESAMAYMQAHPEFGDDWQIDVISIQKMPSKDLKILHFENAVEEYEQ